MENQQAGSLMENQKGDSLMKNQQVLPDEEPAGDT